MGVGDGPAVDCVGAAGEEIAWGWVSCVCSVILSSKWFEALACDVRMIVHSCAIVNPFGKAFGWARLAGISK